MASKPPPPLTLPPAALQADTSEPSAESHNHSRDIELSNLSPVPQSLSPLSGTTSTAEHRSIASPQRNSSRNEASAQNSHSATPIEISGNEHARVHWLKRCTYGWSQSVKHFWCKHISITVDLSANRDHLALERTYLGYLRTSLAFVQSGVLVAQLFRLQHSLNPNLTYGYYVLGIPLAATFICVGIIVLSLGAYHTWHQQQALVRGKVDLGRREIWTIMVLGVGVCLASFVLVTAAGIKRDFT